MRLSKGSRGKDLLNFIARSLSPVEFAGHEEVLVPLEGREEETCLPAKAGMRVASFFA